MVVSLWASSSSSLGPPFILSSSSSLSSSSFITSLFVWKKEGQRVVVVVWSAKQKHFWSIGVCVSRARATHHRYTNNNEGKREGKNGKKKEGFFFSKIFPFRILKP